MGRREGRRGKCRGQEGDMGGGAEKRKGKNKEIP